MKKSKVIIPAIAIIAFSTAASIAGSVAWFTATRTVTINAGSYAVVKTTSNIEAKVTAGIGTSVSNNEVTFNGKLTDASFNHLLKNVYEPDAAGTALGDTIALADAIADPDSTVLRTTLSGGVKVYSIATFNIEFTMNFGSGAKDVGIFLDNTTGKTACTTSGTAYTAKGFRMAFVPDTGNAKVLADLQTSANCAYVTGSTTFTNGVAYTTDLMDSSYGATLPTPTTARATATARPDYLGLITATPGIVKKNYTVVVWYEGTDPEIKNRAQITDYQEVAAMLYFEAIDLADAE